MARRSCLRARWLDIFDKGWYLHCNSRTNGRAHGKPEQKFPPIWRTTEMLGAERGDDVRHVQHQQQNSKLAGCLAALNAVFGQNRSGGAAGTSQSTPFGARIPIASVEGVRSAARPTTLARSSPRPRSHRLHLASSKSNPPLIALPIVGSA